jgi:excisionase family DNA binding protein
MPWITRPFDAAPLADASRLPTTHEQDPEEDEQMNSGSAGRPQTQLAFTSSQAANYLGVSLATVRRWSNNGHLKGYRTPGGQRRYSREQLDAFLTSLANIVAPESVAHDDDARSAA